MESPHDSAYVSAEHVGVGKLQNAAGSDFGVDTPSGGCTPSTDDIGSEKLAGLDGCRRNTVPQRRVRFALRARLVLYRKIRWRLFVLSQAEELTHVSTRERNAGRGRDEDTATRRLLVRVGANPLASSTATYADLGPNGGRPTHSLIRGGGFGVEPWREPLALDAIGRRRWCRVDGQSISSFTGVRESTLEDLYPYSP